jgi:TPR repeat protein
MPAFGSQCRLRGFAGRAAAASFAGLVGMLSLPAFAADPTFGDLLDKAEAEVRAGHRWEPQGDNLADTMVALFNHVQTATPEQLALFKALLERESEDLKRQLPIGPADGARQAKDSLPTVAPSASVQAPPQHPDRHAQDMFARGQSAERSGDISAARRFYVVAADQGHAAAALHLGRLYDPVFLSRTAMGGIDPDPAAARHWYDLAAKLGDPDAPPLLQTLNAR